MEREGGRGRKRTDRNDVMAIWVTRLQWYTPRACGLGWAADRSDGLR